MLARSSTPPRGALLVPLLVALSAAHGVVGVGALGEVPGPPDDVTANPGPGAGEVTLAWAPPADRGSGPILTYSVWRSETEGGTATLVAEVPASETEWTDSMLLPFTGYHYRVAAANRAGEGPPSPEVCAVPFPWLESGPFGCLEVA